MFIFNVIYTILYCNIAIVFYSVIAFILNIQTVTIVGALVINI